MSLKRFYSFLYFRVRSKKDSSANRIKIIFAVLEEKSDNHARYSKYRWVYALLTSFLKQFKKLFFHLIEHALRSLLVFKYIWLFLRKIKIRTGDTLNSKLSIHVPKKVLVEKDVIHIKNCSRGRLNLPGEAGQFASIYICLIMRCLKLVE